MRQLPDHALFDAPDARTAEALQTRFAPLVTEWPLAAPPRFVAGVDTAFDPADPARAVAAAALWDLEAGELLETALAEGRVGFDYAPGLLAFRETPLALAAARRLRRAVDLWLYDGNGRWHPRRFGAACHFGLALDAPTIGVAKTPAGPYAAPGPDRGATSGIDGLALALRSRAGVKPVFVSVGHKVTLPQAAALTLACCAGFRQPEPLRAADRAGRRAAAGAPA